MSFLSLSTNASTPAFPIGNTTAQNLSRFGTQSSANPDALSQLNPLYWVQPLGSDPIQFPIMSITTSGGQSLAMHLYVDQDSGRAENLGRVPLKISVHAIFVNTVYPGGLETWNYGELFPTVYTQLLNTLITSTNCTGTLAHPTFGAITARVESFEETLSSEQRGGPELKITFVETLPDSGNGQALVVANAIQQSASSASAVDNSLATLSPNPQAFGLMPPTQSFAAFVQDITSIVASVQSTIQSFNPQNGGSFAYGFLATAGLTGQVNATLNQISMLQQQCSNANNIALSPLVVSLNAFKYNIQNVANQAGINATNALIGRYTTTQRTSLSSLAQFLMQDLPIFVQLNPALVAKSYINPNTTVRYQLP